MNVCSYYRLPEGIANVMNSVIFFMAVIVVRYGDRLIIFPLLDLFVLMGHLAKWFCLGKTMLRRKGFTLIEVSIYLFLLTCVSLLLFGFIGRMHTIMALFKHKNETYIRYVLATDVLFRDVISASCALSDWDSQHGVFLKETILPAGDVVRVCVGWEATPKGLIRHEGDYDFVKKAWRSKKTSYLSPRVTSIVFFYAQNKKTHSIERVSITLMRNTIKDTLFIRLRNGVMQG